MHTSRGRGMRAAARASAFFSEHGRRAKREPENMVYWYCRLCYYCITKAASQTNGPENICEGCSPGQSRLPIVKKRGRRTDTQRFSRGSWLNGFPLLKKFSRSGL